MALIDIDVYHEHQTVIDDDPSKDVSADEWNHKHTVSEGSITLPMLSAAAQAGAVRTTAVYTTGTLATSASETGYLFLAKGYRLLHIQTSRAARVRIYVTPEQRTADATRSWGALPVGNHGLVLDFATTASMLTADICPIAHGYCESGNASIAITNTGTSGTVQLTLTYAPTEV